MKKIMFDDKYGLTAAVLSGKKTMTRRIIKAPRRSIEGKEVCGFAINKTSDGVPYEVWLTGPNEESLCQLLPTYKVGEIVAVAQCYEDAILDVGEEKWNKIHKWYNINYLCHEKGLHNKMFVSADLMPHHIRITDIKVERLQDISDNDCIAEGIKCFPSDVMPDLYTFEGVSENWKTAREAFARLIDKVSGKGTWNRNPYVFAYTFELVKGGDQ